MADSKMLLDIAAGGCKLGSDGDFIPFATMPGSVPIITEISAAVQAMLPEPLQHQLQNFQGTAGQKKRLEMLLMQFASMVTEKPAKAP